MRSIDVPVEQPVRLASEEEMVSVLVNLNAILPVLINGSRGFHMKDKSWDDQFKVDAWCFISSNRENLAR